MTDDSKITLDTETESETPETPETPEIPEEATDSASEATDSASEATDSGGDGQGDPNVLGKVEREKSKQIQDYRDQVGMLTQELGRVTAKLLRMEGQVGEVRVQQTDLAQQLANIENEAQEYLNKIGMEFGIQTGEPWQILPDGTVRKLDPNLLQAARAAAEANARAQAQ